MEGAFLDRHLGGAGMETRCQVWNLTLHGSICRTYKQDYVIVARFVTNKGNRIG